MHESRPPGGPPLLLSPVPGQLIPRCQSLSNHDALTCGTCAVGAVANLPPPCLHEHVVSPGPCPVRSPRGPGRCVGCAAAPLPRPGLWDGSRGWGGSQIAKTEVASIPTWEARCPHASAFFVLAGSLEPAAEPYLSRLGLPAWGRVPGLSVFIASYVPSSGPLACHLCPQARCHHPRQALPGPSQDNCGTKRAQSEPSLCLPSPRLPCWAQA